MIEFKVIKGFVEMGNIPIKPDILYSNKSRLICRKMYTCKKLHVGILF